MKKEKKCDNSTNYATYQDVKEGQIYECLKEKTPEDKVEEILKEFDYRFTEKSRYVGDMLTFLDQALTSIVAQAKALGAEEEREERRRFAERLKLETDVAICECGEKVSEWDIADLIARELQALQNPKES